MNRGVPYEAQNSHPCGRFGWPCHRCTGAGNLVEAFALLPLWAHARWVAVWVNNYDFGRNDDLRGDHDDFRWNYDHLRRDHDDVGRGHEHFWWDDEHDLRGYSRSGAWHAWAVRTWSAWAWSRPSAPPPRQSVKTPLRQLSEAGRSERPSLRNGLKSQCAWRSR